MVWYIGIITAITAIDYSMGNKMLTNFASSTAGGYVAT